MLASIDPRLTVVHALPKGGVGVEIGVYKGVFSELLLRIAQPKTLHLVDPWVSSDADEHRGAMYSEGRASQTAMDEILAGVKSRFAKPIENGRIVIHREMSNVAMKTFADDSLDFVYIDGDHTERGVTVDLDWAFRKVKRGGLICGDDYSIGQWWAGGVVRATHKFIGEHFDQLMIVFVSQHQFMLRKIAPLS
jgi:hypothetical protein